MITEQARRTDCLLEVVVDYTSVAERLDNALAAKDLRMTMSAASIAMSDPLGVSTLCEGKADS